MGALIDRTGDRYGQLTVLRRDDNTKEGKATWVCLCTCGITKTVAATSLASGVTSCGCQAGKWSYKDETGKTYGNLTVVRDAGRSAQGRVLWDCSCACGNSKIAAGSYLRNGTISSCGCLSAKPNFGHGLSKLPLYNLWRGIIYRCYKGSSLESRIYREKNIGVCKAWLGDVSLFIAWAETNGYRRGLEIDRVDNEGDYEPDNCRFVTTYVNQHNKGILMRTNSTGYAGVSQCKKTGNFYARLQSKLLDNNNCKRLGTYSTPEEAAHARNNFIIKHNLPHQIQEIR